MNNNPETYLISHNRFIDYLVLIFVDRKKAQIYTFEYGFNDVKFPYAYDKTNIYYMLHQKYEPLEKYKKSTIKNEYDYLYRNNKVNGKKLRNYELIHEWSSCYNNLYFLTKKGYFLTNSV